MKLKNTMKNGRFNLWAKTRNFFQRFNHNTAGNIALVTAIGAIPIMLTCGFAIDMRKYGREETKLKAALDAAALASVLPSHLNDIERKAYAQSIFDDNYFGEQDVNLSITASPSTVRIEASADMISFMGGLGGVDSFEIKTLSQAELTRSDVICVLALDPTGAESLKFSDEAMFSSSSCSVQVNSYHSSAMVSTSRNHPNAKSFCVTGISRGHFTPFVKHDCTPVADPYENVPLPADGPCMNVRSLKGNLLTYQPILDPDDVIGNFAEMRPGTYCKGVKISGINVDFLPGTYVFKKGISFKKYSSVKGRGVSMVLKGQKSKVKIESGAQVDMEAASTGTYAGLVFFQKPEKALSRKAKLPTAISEIKSGGGLRLVGTAYLPTQKLLITSDSPVVSQSPATSFIAYNLEFAGKAHIDVKIDHNTAGLPPILPRSDHGARLTR